MYMHKLFNIIYVTHTISITCAEGVQKQFLKNVSFRRFGALASLHSQLCVYFPCAQFSSNQFSSNYFVQSISSNPIRLGQVRFRLGQVRLGQIRLGQVRLGQVLIGRKQEDENRLDEKWVYRIINTLSATCTTDGPCY